MGEGNAAMQARLFGGAGAGPDVARFPGMDQLLIDVRGQPLIATSVDQFMMTNLYTAMVRLVEREKWDSEFAASWLGQAVVETGKKDLEQLDVVERGSGAGRGMFQYTGARRRPYDRARARARRNGEDVNDIDWQIDYALEQDNPHMDLDRMREGLTDPDRNYRFNRRWGTATGLSPTGHRYPDRFADANALMSAYGDDRIGGYSRALTGEYTRPGTPHMDRRLAASKRILSMYRQAVRNRQLLHGPRMV